MIFEFLFLFWCRIKPWPPRIYILLIILFYWTLRVNLFRRCHSVFWFSISYFDLFFFYFLLQIHWLSFFCVIFKALLFLFRSRSEVHYFITFTLIQSCARSANDLRVLHRIFSHYFSLIHSKRSLAVRNKPLIIRGVFY